MSRPLLACLVLAAFTLPPAASAERIQGLVDPSREVTLAAPLDGIVAELHCEEGDRVTEGQVLALMDDRLQQVEVEKAQLRAEAEAPLQEAEAVLAEQQITVERAEASLAGGAAGDWEVRRARLQRDQAAAALLDAQDQQKLAATELRLQKELLARHRVQSPFDGRVTRRLVEPGTNLQRGGDVLSLVSLKPLHARIYLPIEMFGRLKVGETYPLEPDFVISTQTIRAKLIAQDPVIDSASRTFRCLFEIDNADEALPAGFVVFLDTDDVPAAASAPSLLSTPGGAAESEPAAEEPAAPAPEAGA